MEAEKYVVPNILQNKRVEKLSGFLIGLKKKSVKNKISSTFLLPLTPEAYWAPQICYEGGRGGSLSCSTSAERLQGPELDSHWKQGFFPFSSLSYVSISAAFLIRSLIEEQRFFQSKLKLKLIKKNV